MVHDANIDHDVLAGVMVQYLAEGHCVVVGLQSTGEMATELAVARMGEDMEDFVSGPKVRQAGAVLKQPRHSM